MFRDIIYLISYLERVKIKLTSTAFVSSFLIPQCNYFLPKNRLIYEAKGHYFREIHTKQISTLSGQELKFTIFSINLMVLEVTIRI
jgi:hypothetical protein